MLFTFGTLMDQDLLQLVSGQLLSSLQLEPAYVNDKLPHWVVNDDYPVLASAPGKVTTGVLIGGLSQVAMDRIVFFEGEEFELSAIDVQTATGDWCRAQFFKDTQRKEVSEVPWFLTEWQQKTKSGTMMRTEAYMSYFGKLSASEADAYW